MEVERNSLERWPVWQNYYEDLTPLAVEQTLLAEKWEIFKEELKQAAIERLSQLQFVRRQRENALHDILKKLCQAEYEFPGGWARGHRSCKRRTNPNIYREISGSCCLLSRGTLPVGRGAYEKSAFGGENVWSYEKHCGTRASEHHNERQRRHSEYFCRWLQEHFENSNDTCNISELDLLSHVPRLPDLDRTNLKEELTPDEINAVVAQLPLSESRGPGGISAEFYKKAL